MNLGLSSFGDEQEDRIALPVANLAVPPYLEIVDDELRWAWVEPGEGKLRVFEAPRAEASSDGPE